MKKTEFMEQIKILSMIYSTDFDINKITLWYEYLKDIDYISFKKIINEIIKENKYMPAISEILEKSKLIKEKRRYEILEIMKQDNYFANDMEYDKAVKYLEKNIIPTWFIKDMKKYNKILIENSKMLLTN